MSNLMNHYHISMSNLHYLSNYSYLYVVETVPVVWRSLYLYF